MKTKPLVAEDFLGGVFTLYRNKEEYDSYTQDKKAERLENAYNELRLNIDMLQSILQGHDGNKIDNLPELTELNQTIRIALDRFDNTIL